MAFWFQISTTTFSLIPALQSGNMMTMASVVAAISHPGWGSKSQENCRPAGPATIQLRKQQASHHGKETDNSSLSQSKLTQQMSPSEPERYKNTGRALQCSLCTRMLPDAHAAAAAGASLLARRQGPVWGQVARAERDRGPLWTACGFSVLAGPLWPAHPGL